MADLIIFRCPQTGMDVETLLHKQEHEQARPYYVAVTCPACTRLHLHEVQPRSVSRADPFSGRFRVDIEYRRRKRTGGRNVPAPSRSVDAHVRDQRYGM